MNLKAMLFDMDGVLALSEPVHFEAWTQVIAALGRDADALKPEEATGYTDARIAGIIKSRLGASESEEVLCGLKTKSFLSLLESGLEPVEGRNEFLEKFKGRVKMAVVSSACRSEVSAILKACGILHYFDFFIGYEDVSTHKPLPEPYLKAIARMGCRASETLAIEDSPAGVNSAKSAGAHVAGLNSSGLLSPEIGAPVFNDFFEIIDWIEGRQNQRLV